MSFQSGFLNSLLLLGSLQGFLIGLLLLFTSRERPSAKLLAWLLLILAMACLKIYLNNIGLNSSEVGSLMDALIPFMFIMPIGPLIYFYCKMELFADFRIQRKDRWHFYPLLIDIFPHAGAFVFLILIMAGMVNPRKNDFGYWFDTYNAFSDIPRWISLSIYLFLSFRLIKIRSKELGFKNETMPASLPWIREFLYVFLVLDIIWLAFLVPYELPRLTDSLLSWLDWYPLYLPVVAVIYWLGIRSFQIGKKEINTLRKSGFKSNPPAESAGQLAATLQRAMNEEKLYLDAELTLSKLANHLKTHPKTISLVLNQNMGKSFNEFVNGYRVEEIKVRLVKPENKKYTIAALAYECGFNSQPTFQRSFKSLVGMTPSEFLQKANGLDLVS